MRRLLNGHRNRLHKAYNELERSYPKRRAAWLERIPQGEMNPEEWEDFVQGGKMDPETNERDKRYEEPKRDKIDELFQNADFKIVQALSELNNSEDKPDESRMHELVNIYLEKFYDKVEEIERRKSRKEPEFVDQMRQNPECLKKNSSGRYVIAWCDLKGLRYDGQLTERIVNRWREKLRKELKIAD